MQEFSMSMYATKEDLYKAKAEYYEELYNDLANKLDFLMDLVPNLDDVLEQYKGEE
jgi:hypothetical protein